MMIPLMKNRRPRLFLALLAVAAVSDVIAVDQRSFSFCRVAEGRLPAWGAVTVLQGVRSSLHCSQACVTSLGLACLSLSYKQEQRESRLYSGFDPGDVNVTSPGHKYYSRCPAQPAWMGEGCSTSGDCSHTANEECRDGTCQCVAGFHFYPCFGTCVASCPFGYGNGFYGVQGYGTYSEYETFLTGFTPELCWQRCRADERCRSFEVRGDSCQLSDTTKLDLPPAAAWVVFPGGTHCVRHCA